MDWINYLKYSEEKYLKKGNNNDVKKIKSPKRMNKTPLGTEQENIFKSGKNN